MSRKKKVLFVAVVTPSFVRQDREYFAQRYNLKTFVQGTPKGWRMGLRQLQLLGWLVANIWGTDFIYVWFADYHGVLPSLFAKLFRKRLYVVMAGYDAAKLPQYSYGVFSKKFRGWAATKTTIAADKIIPLSQFLVRQLEQNTQRAFAHKAEVVPLGAPVSLFSMEGLKDSPGTIICVSNSDDLNRMKIKGIDIFAEAARSCPEFQFILVGATGDTARWLENQQIENLEVFGFVKREELQELYSRAAVVCQLSRYEGFGMVLLEGMLCECVPVSFSEIGPGEIIDESVGFLIDDPCDQARVIRTAVAEQKKKGPLARQKVLNQFTMEHRIEMLEAILKPA